MYIKIGKIKKKHKHETNYWEQCSAKPVLTLRVYRIYVFRYQNRVNSEVNSIFGKIRRFNEFGRVNTQ